jgi:hypothetical protein
MGERDTAPQMESQGVLQMRGRSQDFRAGERALARLR